MAHEALQAKEGPRDAKPLPHLVKSFHPGRNLFSRIRTQFFQVQCLHIKATPVTVVLLIEEECKCKWRSMRINRNKFVTRRAIVQVNIDGKNVFSKLLFVLQSI